LFLRRIVIHPELRSSATLNSFFNDTWNKQKMEDDEEESSKVGTSSKSSIKKWIKDKKTTLAGTLYRSPLDPLFDEMEQYISALESGLKRVEFQTEQMVKRCKKEGVTWMEFGLGCDAVGHVDDYIGRVNETDSKDKQTVGKTFHATSQTADALSTLHQNHHTTLLLHFLLPLRDHLKMIQSAKHSLSKRYNRRITYSTALSNVDAKKQALHKYQITQGCEHKVLNATTSLSKAEKEVEDAKRNYDEVSDRVIREFDRFRTDIGSMMHTTMVEFTRVQCEYSAEMARIWSGQTLVKEVEIGSRGYVDAARGLTGSGVSLVSPPVLEENGILGTVRYRDNSLTKE
jgi:sorting nexin-1/2